MGWCSIESPHVPFWETYRNKTVSSGDLTPVRTCDNCFQNRFSWNNLQAAIEILEALYKLDLLYIIVNKWCASYWDQYIKSLELNISFYLTREQLFVHKYLRRLIPQLMALQTTATATLRKVDIPCHCLNLVIYYHPQRSCKSYVFTGVCLSTGGGGGWYPSMPWRWYPSMPFNRSPWGCYPSMHCRWYPSMPCNRSLGGCLVWGSAPSLCLVWGDVCSQGVCSWGGVPGPRGSARGGLVSQHALRQTPQEIWLLVQMVRIPLECILVFYANSLKCITVSQHY